MWTFAAGSSVALIPIPLWSRLGFRLLYVSDVVQDCNQVHELSFVGIRRVGAKVFHSVVSFASGRSMSSHSADLAAGNGTQV